MSFVFVMDQDRKPLDPVHPGRARFLLSAGHAAVLLRYPFTIILKDRKPDAEPQPLRVKLDPGSKTTGVAVVNDVTGQVVWAAELAHRGDQVQAKLADRRAQRRGRRQRHTRYRQPRFNNRTRRELPKTHWLDAACVGTSTPDVLRVQQVVPLAIQATGSCTIKTAQGTVQHIHIRYCQPLHRGDGYTYTKARSA